MRIIYSILILLAVSSCVTPQGSNGKALKGRLLKKKRQEKTKKIWQKIHGKYETREYDEKYKMDLFHEKGFEIKESKLINFPGSKEEILIKKVSFKDQSGSTEIYDLKDFQERDYVLYVKEEGRVDIVSPKKWGAFKKFKVS